MHSVLRTVYQNHYHTYPLASNLRFELAHNEGDPYPLRIKKGKNRAEILFAAVFKDVDVLQLIFFVTPIKKRNHFSKFLIKNDFKVIDSFAVEPWRTFSDEEMIAIVIEIKKNNLRRAKLIDSLFYQDFPEAGKSKIHHSIVFYNPEKQLLLNIYDDRGCDLWSPNTQLTNEFYKQYGDWLLDYDRPNMDDFYRKMS